MEPDAARRLLLSKRKVRDPGPAPVWATAPGQRDEVRAQLFRHLLLRLGVRRDGLALVAGVSGNRIAAMCGDAGPLQVKWSEVPPEQVDALEAALRHVEPKLNLWRELHMRRRS